MGIGTQFLVSVPNLLCTMGYRYQLWVTIPFCGFCPEMANFAISHSFFFNKPPQIHPTSKSTMESIQNNSKSGYRYQLWVPVPFCGFCPEIADLAISHPFFFNKPPQIHLTSKSTTESTQNSSKSGLAPIKTLFS